MVMEWTEGHVERRFQCESFEEHRQTEMLSFGFASGCLSSEQSEE